MTSDITCTSSSQSWERGVSASSSDGSSDCAREVGRERSKERGSLASATRAATPTLRTCARAAAASCARPDPVSRAAAVLGWARTGGGVLSRAGAGWDALAAILSRTPWALDRAVAVAGRGASALSSSGWLKSFSSSSSSPAGAPTGAADTPAALFCARARSSMSSRMCTRKRHEASLTRYHVGSWTGSFSGPVVSLTNFSML
mmetsp:Transcript_12658/g.33883  ORF Transcript_12658/g.33883 Transcript_12658/m.33883 type:complete len:203 (-) Transcript_12658:218-826(-)